MVKIGSVTSFMEDWLHLSAADVRSGQRPLLALSLSWRFLGCNNRKGFWDETGKVLYIFSRVHFFSSVPKTPTAPSL
jgi:hypothetical protein